MILIGLLFFRLLEEINRYSTVIIIGETGSGKTTQIPQLLLQAGMAGTSGRIGITQPRRIAAVSVARRVAEEQGVKLGKLVGYCVRFEDCTSQETRIKYLTDGMMVREAMTDEILSDYSVITIIYIITAALKYFKRLSFKRYSMNEVVREMNIVNIDFLNL